MYSISNFIIPANVGIGFLDFYCFKVGSIGVHERTVLARLDDEAKWDETCNGGRCGAPSCQRQ